MWDMTHSCETWLIHMRDTTHSYVRHELFICVTWLIHMCDMTHSYVRHDAFICVPWLIHTCDMTLSHIWDDSFICDDAFWHATWLMTHICRRLNARQPRSAAMCCEQHIWMRHVTHMSHVTRLARRRCALSGVTCLSPRDMTHSHVWHDCSVAMCS